MNNITYNIIVARYNENLNWVNKLDKNNIIIYNKGGDYVENAISRENVGRDPETFLYHIIENYDNLPDYLLFVQGNPFDHMTNINADNFQHEINKLINNNIPVKPLFTYVHKENHYTYPSIKTPEYYSLFFKGGVPNVLEFASGCQYIVSKQNILNRPKKFYEKIYSMIYNTKIVMCADSCYGVHGFDVDTMDVWCLERLLFYIFKGSIQLSDQILQINAN